MDRARALEGAGAPLVPHLIAEDASFKGDEGYSEDTRSLDDGDSTMGVEPRFPPPDPLHALYEAILALDETRRSEHAYNVLRTLRTSSIAAIVERLTPLLHLDPVAKLPPDITSTLFSYLEPASLLQASLVSKAWRERTLDTLLWRDKFRREGWTLNMDEVRRVERAHQATSRGTTNVKVIHDVPHRRFKRTAQDISKSPAPGSPPVAATGGAWPLTDGTGDQVMQDAEAISGSTAAASFDRMDTGDGSGTSVSSLTMPLRHPESVVSDEETNRNSLSRPPLLTRSYSGGARVNFYHVYQQKRRLEDNWAKGRYKSFQLPHKDHPEEAHSECVYTIQYSGNFLVSGSRDKTLRIWNLDTQRLVRRPLEGHRASVLCLQFDAGPTEDIIISGSSDTDVILWQFSTGKMLKRIQSAHRESVLNLKFDKRFLVTCSKDKMIKIWNRKALLPGDPDYPQKGMHGGGRCPSYVVDWAQLPSPLDLDRMIEQKQIEAIPEYSLIMKIDDHGAAVNAVHIYHDQLVSASGDRALRVFDIHSGVRVATCKGHTKGIACVQYDGKRIVSGSSDNTIRIFDPKSQAEVACLRGHSKLVRTIQASFGDVPGAEEDLEKEARAADHAYFSAKVASGKPLDQRTPTRRERERAREHTLRNPRRPEDLTALGAKLPPGGGGSPWARIVSGSYDETIIIWRKGTDGRWKVGHTLLQADALQAAGGPLIAQSERGILPHLPESRFRPRVNPAQAAIAGQQQSSTVVPGGFVAYQPIFRHSLSQTGAPSSSGATVGSTSHTVVAGSNSQMASVGSQGHDSNTTSPTQPQSAQQDEAGVAMPDAPSTQAGHVSSDAPHSALPRSAEPGEAPADGSAGASSATALPNTHTNAHPSVVPATAAAGSGSSHTLAATAHAAAVAAAAGAGLGAGVGGQAVPVPAPVHVPPPPSGNVPPAHPNARVFKLQFDARRIICCSQDPKIVGWDFANGDTGIEAAACFFGSPS